MIDLRKQVSFLEIFYYVTCIFSESYSKSIFLPSAHGSINTNEGYAALKCLCIVNGWSDIFKFEKYWAKYSTILVIVVILNPTTKFSY